MIEQKQLELAYGNLLKARTDKLVINERRLSDLERRLEVVETKLACLPITMSGGLEPLDVWWERFRHLWGFPSTVSADAALPVTVRNQESDHQLSFSF